MRTPKEERTVQQLAVAGRGSARIIEEGEMATHPVRYRLQGATYHISKGVRTPLYTL
jgi:hypothetical protein